MIWCELWTIILSTKPAEARNRCGAPGDVRRNVILRPMFSRPKENLPRQRYWRSLGTPIWCMIWINRSRINLPVPQDAGVFPSTWVSWVTWYTVSLHLLRRLSVMYGKTLSELGSIAAGLDLMVHLCYRLQEACTWKSLSTSSSRLFSRHGTIPILIVPRLWRIWTENSCRCGVLVLTGRI